MRFYLTLFSLFVATIGMAQFSEDFSDGNFSDSPIWSGLISDFEVDVMNQLHLSAPAVSDTSYLAVSSSLINDVTWDFWVSMDFNPSSSNYTRVYLMATNENLKGELNGYFVMIGNTTDEISLYRQTGTTIEEIIDGTDDVVDESEVNVRVRVTRDALGNFEMFRDSTGGSTFVSEGTALDDTFTASSYFGVFCKYTSTRSELFYFDDIGVPYTDAVQPTIEEVSVVSENSLTVLFSEFVDVLSATTLTNYSVNDGVGNPVEAIINELDSSRVNLSFGTDFINGATYNITMENVEDRNGNSIVSPTVLPFIYLLIEEATNNEVIITELLSDPNPVIGLPEVEFVELYNRSDKIFDLENWTINDNTNTAVLGSYLLYPSEYVVICGVGEGILFDVSNILEVESLPTLTNAEDDIVIRKSDGLEIDAIHYMQSWYKDVDKEDGGWTIERKHLDAPCNDISNWGASIDPTGGTPGLQNSIWTDIDDIDPPIIFNFEMMSDSELVIHFTEYCDTSIDLAIDFSPEVESISGAFTNVDTYNLNVFTLTPSTTYTIAISGATDCWGNTTESEIDFSLPGIAEQGDLILNEVMFDPLSGGSDYIELYNMSDKVLDLNELFIANWEESDGGAGIDNVSEIGATQFLVSPGEYVLLTEDSTNIINDFSIYGQGRFLITDLPTYPNDSGTVYLLNVDSTIMDYFHYDEDFHFDLLNTTDGKALERITFGGGLNNPENWRTASEIVDWGTPGYKNSQFKIPNTIGEVSIDPQLFSPDNDGYNDVLTINFDLKEVDNVIDVQVFDNQGRLIRHLQDNYFLGLKGILTWDGINDEGTKAAIGTYIVLISVKAINGQQQQYKLVTVLGGQL